MRAAWLAAALALVGVAAALPAAQTVVAGEADLRWTGELIQGGLIAGQVPAGTTTLTLDSKPVQVAADGRFVAGFDRDAPAMAMLEATLADGRRIARTLAIARRAWDISRLPTLPKTPLPDAEFARVRPPEPAQIEEASAIVTDAAGWR